MKFSEICTFAVIYAAYLAARRGKRSRAATAHYEVRLLENIVNLVYTPPPCQSKRLAMSTLLRSSTLWNMPAMLNTATAQPKAAGCLDIISSHCLSRTLKALPLLRLSESWNSS